MLTNSAHFLLVKTIFSLEKLAKIYVDSIINWHGEPVSIVSDSDPCFTLNFWPSLQSALRTKLNFSTSFHPQNDG